MFAKWLGMSVSATPIASHRFAVRVNGSPVPRPVSLRQSGIRGVTLVLVELARSKKAAWPNKHLVQLIDDRGLADPSVVSN